ncbi:MAG: cation diffusion facilitator family transporter [Nitrososphaerota archaeon]
MNNKANIKALSYALFLTLIIMFFEIIGSIISGSLALMSDAAHMLIDSTSLIVAFIALKISEKKPTENKTYGFYRAEILSAFINGILLAFVAFYIFREAYLRLFNPINILEKPMLIVAIIGLSVNIFSALILFKPSNLSLSIKGAFLHVLSDAVSSIGVIIGGIIIFFTKLYVVDTLIGIGISILIFRGSYQLLKEAINVLMEGVPKGLKLENIINEIIKVKGVKNIHDIHVWSIATNVNALSAHIVLDNISLKEADKILNEINILLKNKFNITHTTLQIECDLCPKGTICIFSPENENQKDKTFLRE